MPTSSVQPPARLSGHKINLVINAQRRTLGSETTEAEDNAMIRNQLAVNGSDKVFTSNGS